MGIVLSRRSWLRILAAGVAASDSDAADERQDGLAPDIHEQIRSWLKQAPLSMRFMGTTAGECRSWQQAFAAKLRELLGEFSPPQKWETVTERVVDLDGYRREELILRAEGHSDLPVYLLVPSSKADLRAGVLALHGHGSYGADSIVGIATSPERKKEIATFNYDFGVQLARRGYVVAAPCFIPFGRRADPQKAYGGHSICAITFLRLQELGKLTMAENLRDALWSIELLVRRKDVDASRIGCVGLSYGGRMTMLTAALEPRIRIAVMSGCLNLMQERMSIRHDCGSQIIPGLLKYGDVPEISSLIAPRRCLWEVGKRDPLISKEWADIGLERIRRAYRALSAEDKLEIEWHEGDHRWNGVRAYDLLEEAL